MFGNLVYLLTKDASRWIANRCSWSMRMPIPQTVISKLEFWLRNLYVITRQPLVKEDDHIVIVIVYSDASKSGCRAYVLGDMATEMVHY